MELYVSRHGETLANIEKRLAGSKSDSPLTEKGIMQAKELGQNLNSISFDVVYSSPLQRAVNTVNIAFDNKYIINVDDRLSEINLGVMDGMTYDEASLRFPQSGMRFFTDPKTYEPVVNGESLHDMIARISYFLDDLIKKDYDKVFVMTHGMALRVLYSCTKSKSIFEIEKAPIYSNCEVVRYTYDNGMWILNI